MELLDFPINHNHIQNRVDGFKEWLYQLDYEQVEDILADIEQYLLDCADAMEINELDCTVPMNAAARISEARWWVFQIE